MNITEEDLKDINTYGYKYILQQGCLTIDLPHAIVTITKRPSYCDRGRFGFFADVKEGFHHKLTIDWADFFPRYFFNLQRSFDEMNDWIIFNKEKLGLIKNQNTKA